MTKNSCEKSVEKIKLVAELTEIKDCLRTLSTMSVEYQKIFSANFFSYLEIALKALELSHLLGVANFGDIGHPLRMPDLIPLRKFLLTYHRRKGTENEKTKS